MQKSLFLFEAAELPFTLLERKNDTISIHSEGVPLLVVGIKNIAHSKMNIDRCGMILSQAPSMELTLTRRGDLFQLRGFSRVRQRRELN